MAAQSDKNKAVVLRSWMSWLFRYLHLITRNRASELDFKPERRYLEVHLEIRSVSWPSLGAVRWSLTGPEICQHCAESPQLFIPAAFASMHQAQDFVSAAPIDGRPNYPCRHQARLATYPPVLTSCEKAASTCKAWCRDYRMHAEGPGLKNVPRPWNKDNSEG